MKTLNVLQGSPEWLAARSRCFCASDAPAMMGASKRVTRSDLVRMKATGDEKTFSAWQQKNLLDKGHETEDAARALTEQQLGEDLYPVTATNDEGTLLASFDGITMSGTVGYEHKLWNEELAAAVRAGSIDLPGGHEWQLEQQIIVGGLEKVLFVCSDGTPEKRVQMEYRAVPGRAEKLLAGWAQFDEDVKNYKHVEVLPAPRGREISALPVLNIKLSGKVKTSNLADYRAIALEFIEQIKTDLKTDQDFADADEAVKFCADAEAKLKLAKDQAIAQTASIEELFRTIDEIGGAMRGKRLELEKLVDARKKAIRAEILAEGQTAFSAHITALNNRIGRPLMPPVPVDFAGVMKGKKTVKSLRDAVDAEVARGKIEANAVADRITLNLKTLEQEAGQYTFLFADLGQIVTKGTDDFAAVVKMRVSEHLAKPAPAPASAPAASATPPAPPPAAPLPANVSRLRVPEKPSDVDLVRVIAAHWQVDSATAIKWLRAMDWQNNAALHVAA